MKLIQRHSFLKNLCVLLFIILTCVFLCHLLSFLFNDNNPFAVPIFVLGVALISRFTNGYFWGIASAMIGVFCVNYMFTFPFWEFDMTISGYPLTFTVMLLVSIIISALTTQVKQQQRILYEAKSESMRANLLRAISHDIRTPLASIVGASSALLDQKELPPDTREELLQSIHKDAQWLARVTENILSVTKFSGEGVRLKLTEEVAEEIVGSAIRKFRRINGSIPIVVHKPDDILLVPMEATLIEQVLINLLENVVHHGKYATQIVITITSDGRRAAFDVSDNGAGIAEEVLPHLFDGSLLSKDGVMDGNRNMGIGLSVCRSIVAAHGGGMTAHNDPGGGAIISFWLPMEETHEY